MSIPKTMQAVGIHQTGDFDVIDKFELPVPENAPGHVLVKVRLLSPRLASDLRRSRADAARDRRARSTTRA